LAAALDLLGLGGTGDGEAICEGWRHIVDWEDGRGSVEKGKASTWLY
jgi:hypothetical protein